MRGGGNRITEARDAITRLLRAAFEAKRAAGKGLLSQLREMNELRRYPNCVSPSEYYDFGLYAPNVDRATRHSYLGWRSPVINDLQRTEWRALANDKLAFQGMMAGLGFRVPRIYGLYSKSNRYFGATPVFGDPDTAADFLRQSCPYPFYGKPADGLYGQGNILCAAYLPASDALEISTGDTVPVQSFVKTHLGRSRNGYLFQEVLKPSEAIASLWGDRLSTVRIVIALCESGPKLVLGEWKIPTGNNFIDNFHDGQTGNLLALVDPANGAVKRVALPNGTVTSDPSIRHPDTGTPIIGTHVPNWPGMVVLAMTAARALPGLRLQGWDIADTSVGLVPLEVNLVTGRTAYNHQHFMQKGLFDAEVLRTWENLPRRTPPHAPAGAA